jgi:hypothetical protein
MPFKGVFIYQRYSNAHDKNFKYRGFYMNLFAASDRFNGALGWLTGDKGLVSDKLGHLQHQITALHIILDQQFHSIAETNEVRENLHSSPPRLAFDRTDRLVSLGMVRGVEGQLGRYEFTPVGKALINYLHAEYVAPLGPAAAVRSAPAPAKAANNPGG